MGKWAKNLVSNFSVLIYSDLWNLKFFQLCYLSVGDNFLSIIAINYVIYYSTCFFRYLSY